MEMPNPQNDHFEPLVERQLEHSSFGIKVHGNGPGLHPYAEEEPLSYRGD